jgi:hypothetical protein
MPALRYIVDVADLAAGAGPDGHLRRVAGVLPDNETVALGRMVAGSGAVETEFTFTLAEGQALCEACLAGDRRALTRPGLARILSATAAVLFRVAHHAGSFQAIEDIDGGGAGLLHDQLETGGDEGADH